MDYNQLPRIEIKKRSTPVIYLDTNAMIELSRHEKGTCTISHKKEIGELYDILTSAKREKRILCPHGNQLEEMGNARGREYARDFLFRFVNCDFLIPQAIEQAELTLGYKALVNKSSAITLDAMDCFQEDPFPDRPYTIRAFSPYDQPKLQELSQKKKDITTTLNAMKSSGQCEKDFVSQLEAELASAFVHFNNILANCMNSQEDFVRYVDYIGPVYSRIGMTMRESEQERLEKIQQYGHFLRSPYHHKLPYAWIEAVLWAHRMQRDKKVSSGDNLDTVWAAAYLPFVDYAVTDTDFCTLLQTSGLADLYGTKVFCFGTLSTLIETLKSNL
ncbi:MAG: hypothetical protein IJO69_05230 [Ruminiclostridium sp.]|nr:hypothetical protein [Ruminiclostridium sp.]